MSQMVKKMKKSEILGHSKKIYIRLIKISDVNKRYVDWLKDKEVTKFLES